MSHSLTPMAGKGLCCLTKSWGGTSLSCAEIFPELPKSACRTDHKILKLVSLSEDLCSTEWQLADVRANRGEPPMPPSQILVQESCQFFRYCAGKGKAKLSKTQLSNKFSFAMKALKKVNLYIEA